MTPAREVEGAPGLAPVAADTTDVHDLLGRLPGCARLSPEALAPLVRASRLSGASAGTRLWTEGEPAPDWVGILESGGVQLSRVDLEADQTLDYLTAGDVLDPGPAGLPAPCSATVVEASRGLFVPQSAVAEARAAPRPAADEVQRAELPLLVRRVAELLKGPAVTCSPGTPVAAAAERMTASRVGSVVVVGDDGAVLGIVTDRDLRTKVVARGLPSTAPAGGIMSSPVLSIAPGASALDALLEMVRRDLHHLAVVDGGRLVGVVSSHDLILLQGAHPVALARALDRQPTVDGLAAVARELPGLVRRLARDGAGVFDLGRIVAELNDRLVRRVVDLVETEIDAAGLGRPPVPYSWLAAGSEGRKEQTLKTDQDNALVWDDPPPELAPAAQTYFARLAEGVGAALTRLGVPPCDGGYMASNPRWRQPRSAWQEIFGRWLAVPQPDRLLHAAVFFDLRPVAGVEGPGRDLWNWVCDQAPSATLFLRYMAREAVERHPPLGFLGRFVVERSGEHKDALDLKGRGVFPVTQAMRVLALSFGVRATGTVERLVEAGRHGVFTAGEVAELRDAYQVIARLRLDHQLACLDAGTPPDNFVNPHALGKADRLLLREAFRSVSWLQDRLADRFQTGLIA